MDFVIGRFECLTEEDCRPDDEDFNFDLPVVNFLRSNGIKVMQSLGIVTKMGNKLRFCVHSISVNAIELHPNNQTILELYTNNLFCLLFFFHVLL